jgi:hypothetical protein
MRRRTLSAINNQEINNINQRGDFQYFNCDFISIQGSKRFIDFKYFS